MKVLFYDDAPNFGGHEMMTLAAIKHLVAQPDTTVGFVFAEVNQRLSQHLQDISKDHHLDLFPLHYSSQGKQALRSLLSKTQIRRIAELFRDYDPDLIVVAQGGIAVSSAGLLAAKKAHIPVVSYIPMTHPETLFTPNRYKAAAKALLHNYFYKLPDMYITLSEQMCNYLLQRKLTMPIATVQNGIELTNYRRMDKSDSRKLLGLPPDTYLVGIVGRIELWQKCHDLLLDAVQLASNTLPNLAILIVGEGPDRQWLADRVSELSLDKRVLFSPWVNDLSPIFSAIDLLAIPSRYEGVPLVMLEAMYLECPIVAAATDGMLDVLPKDWLFEPGNAQALANEIIRAASTDKQDMLIDLRKKIDSNYSVKSFQCNFEAALQTACKQLGKQATQKVGHSSTATAT